MEPESSRVLGIVLYKIVSLGVGALSLGFGYKLFMAGVVATAGNLEASGKGMKLKLKNGAPGTFFALFGAIIISYTIGKGLAMSGQQIGGPVAQTENVANAATNNGGESNNISKSALYNEQDDTDLSNEDSPVATSSGQETQDEPKYPVMTDVVYGTFESLEDTTTKRLEESKKEK